MSELFSYIEHCENFLWAYLGVPAIVFLGLTLSIRSGFFQIRQMPKVFKTFFGYFNTKTSCGGVHPLKAFFACIGGCVGIGNVVAICTAVQIGGPGALLWIWVTAILGMAVKYAEVYLGVRYRVEGSDGTYSGGPMYFLQKISKSGFLPLAACVLLCIYGVEVYQFSVISVSISSNFAIDRSLVAFILLLLVIFAGSGGVKRVGSISSAVIPVFVLLYMVMGSWVLLHHLSDIGPALKQVFNSAFGFEAVGGGVFGGIFIAMTQGIRRGCYTGDVGVGYASVIHSQSEVETAEKQASLVIVDIFIDTFLICTMSVMLLLVTDIWSEPMEASLLIQTIFERYFPYVNVFMPLFLFLLGYSTITAYFIVGLKCAQFVSKKWGNLLFYGYAVGILIASNFFDTTQAQSLMAIAGGLLLVINTYGIYRLRHEVSFEIEPEGCAIPLAQSDV